MWMAASYGATIDRVRVPDRNPPALMRIPPQVLAHPEHGLSSYDGTLVIRTADLRGVHDQVTWHNAYAMACQGRIEAVCSAGGRIKYFRLLAESERPAMAPVRSTEQYESTSTVIARTHLGVFREAVSIGVPSETAGPYGGPGTEMQIIGYLWQHCQARLGS
jgi:hypothetical protein